MNKARVLFVTLPLEWGGAEKHLMDLIAHADPAKMNPAILALAPDLYTPALDRMGRTDVPVHQARAWTFREYRRAFAALRPEVIVFVNGWLGIFPSRAYAAARASGARRVIGLEHSQAGAPPAEVGSAGFLAPVRRLIGWRTRHLLGIKASGYLSHVTVCVSDSIRSTLIDEYGYPPGRTLTVHNGIDTNFYRRSGHSRAATRIALGLPENAEVVLYVARLSPLKRIDLLLRAVSTLRDRRPRLKCVIVGGGVLEGALKEAARTLQLDSVVQFAGEREDVRPYYEAADVYTTTSEREGLPLSLAEAMAYELPCIATSIGGHREILSQPGTGELVEPGRPDLMAGAIDALLSSPGTSRTIGIAARKAVVERFNIERMVEELVSTFLKKP